MDMEDAKRRRRVEAGQQQRLRIWSLWGMGVGACLILLGIVFLSEQGASPHPVAILLAVLGGAMMAVGLWAAFRFQKGEAAAAARRAGGSYRDRAQREYAQSIQFMPAVSLLVHITSLRVSWDILQGRGDLADWAFAAMGPMVSLAILMMVAGLGNRGDRKLQRLLQDELTQSFRRRALSLALGVAGVGMGAGFVVGLYRPEWGVMAMPLILMAASATAAWRYAWLDRKADPNG